MGEVYRARDTKLGRDVAIKVLPANRRTDPDRTARFEREARAASSLNHPNIVTVYDIGESDGTPFMVMELVSGRSLRTMISERPPLALVLDVGAQTALALAAAHAAGIVHRDIKPENLMLRADGYVKILDFGVARLAAHDLNLSSMATVAATEAGVVPGTARYFAPEQARGETATPLTDVFALGVVLYELLTGTHPFEAPSSLSVLHAIITGSARAPSLVRPGIPPAVDKLLLMLLAKDPRERPPADEVASSLTERLRTTTTPRERTETRGLAVLPLENLSRDPEQEYFADGITDALITALASLSGLRVISRRSSMRYKGTDTPLGEIAAALNVNRILEGTVFCVGARVRITVRLVDPITDANLWSSSYEHDVTDVLALQGRVAQAVAQELLVRLTPDESERLAE